MAQGGRWMRGQWRGRVAALLGLAALFGVTLAGCDAPTLPFASVPAQRCVAQQRGALGAGGGVVVPLAAFDPTATQTHQRSLRRAGRQRRARLELRQHDLCGLG